MIDLLNQLVAEEQTEPAAEVVTLAPEQLTHGVMTGNARPFPDLQSALDYAKTLTTEERDVSWIRTPDSIKSLTYAESEASAAAQKPTPDGPIVKPSR